MKKNILPLRFDLKGMKTLTRCLPLLVLTVAVLLTSCASGDSWPETLYLERLFVDGQEVSASPGNQSEWQYINKTSDEAVTSSATYQADDELVLPISAMSVYEATWYFTVIGHSSVDIKYYLKWTSTNITINGIADYVTFDSGASAMSSITKFDGTTTDELYSQCDQYWPYRVRIKVWIKSASDDNVTLYWAQKVPSAAPTSVLEDSFIEWREIQ